MRLLAGHIGGSHGFFRDGGSKEWLLIFTGDAGNRLHLKMDMPSNSLNALRLVILLP